MAKERKTLSDAVIQRFMTDPNSIQLDHPSNTIPLAAIKLPTRRQPRRYFDAEKMVQLVASVREHGVLEPVLVRPLTDGNYELIAGERRLRAAQEVGLAEIPIVSREFSDQKAFEVALIENLQRDDLNPIEETEAVLELLAIALATNTDEVKSLIYQAANAKSRGQALKGNVSLQLEKIESYLVEMGRFNLESFRTSRLPLLNLPSNILDALREGKLEYTKARAIARLKDPQQQQALLERVIEEKLSLSQIRQEVTAANRERKTNQAPELKQEFDQAYVRLKKSEVWRDRTKQKRLKKLLSEIESLLEG